MRTKLTLLLGFFICSSFQVVVAQANGEPVFAEGVSGQIDTKKRTPVISVGSVVEDGSVVLLVNAYTRDTDTQIYPIKFEVFVNNNLISSQLKPAEQAEPLVVPIDPKIATAPLGYTVHAQIIHPSRTFSSVFSGTVFNSTIVSALSCSVTVVTTDSETSEEAEDIFVAESEDLSIIQNSDTNFQLTLTGTSSDDENLQLNASIDLTDQSNTTASISYGSDEDSLTSVTASGTVVTTEDKQITEINLTSEDEKVSLNCGSN